MNKYFKTNNVIVRRFEMEDLEQVYLNLTQNYDTNNMLMNKENESIKFDSLLQTKMKIRSAINQYYTDEPVWAVEDKANRNLVGYICVCNYSPKNKMCNITWMMCYKYWDNCFMKDALTKIMNFLFTKKEIELIECSYYEQDKKSSIILEEIGMTKEATLRDRRVNERTNKKENFVIYSINKQEFFEIVNYEAIGNRIYKYLKRKI